MMFGVLALVGSVSAQVFAGGNPVPEIDANALSAGLGLLAAGVLIVRSRRRR
jgi:MYXO-CTERM domain-containing protein